LSYLAKLGSKVQLTDQLVQATDELFAAFVLFFVHFVEIDNTAEYDTHFRMSFGVDLGLLEHKNKLHKESVQLRLKLMTCLILTHVIKMHTEATQDFPRS